MITHFCQDCHPQIEELRLVGASERRQHVLPIVFVECDDLSGLCVFRVA